MFRPNLGHPQALKTLKDTLSRSIYNYAVKSMVFQEALRKVENSFILLHFTFFRFILFCRNFVKDQRLTTYCPYKCAF